MKTGPKPQSAAQRFHNLTVNQGDCVVWQGAMDAYGRASFNDGNKTQSVRQFALHLAGQELDKGDVVVATCDTKRCVASEHLMGMSRPAWRQLRTPNIRDRVAARTTAVVGDGCWLWTGGINDHGYGLFDFGGKKWLAHRLMWWLEFGDLPEAVCHNCDNPPCVRPNHLFAGTQLDNVVDMVEKNRQARGEHHSQAKLTEDQVLVIRSDSRSRGAIAASFGISASTVSNIRLRRSWSWL